VDSETKDGKKDSETKDGKKDSKTKDGKEDSETKDGKKDSEANGDDKSTKAKLDALMKTLETIRDGTDTLEKRLKNLESKVAPQEKQPEKQKDPKKAEEDAQALQPHRAVLVVHVPVDARVFLNGRPTRTANQTVRTFITPKLEDDARYSLEVRVEITRDGQARSETRRVFFCTGSRVNVSFPDLENQPATIAARSR
jgi:uncharacterized protein (TIGR03000 family)